MVICWITKDYWYVYTDKYIFSYFRCPILITRRERKRRLEQVILNAGRGRPSFGMELHSV